MATTPATSYRVAPEHRPLMAKIVALLREYPEKAQDLSALAESARSHTGVTLPRGEAMVERHTMETQAWYEEALKRHTIETQAWYEEALKRHTIETQARYDALERRLIAMEKRIAVTASRSPSSPPREIQATGCSTASPTTIGVILTAARESKRVSLRALGATSGISRKIISRIESGERGPTDSELEALVKALEIDPQLVDLSPASPIAAPQPG